MKDLIFDKTEKIKIEPLEGCSSCYKRKLTNTPLINAYTHAQLNQNAIVQEGDEYYFGNAWFLAHPSKWNCMVGNIFIYRRALTAFKYPSFYV